MTTTLKTNTNRHGQNRTLQDHDNMQAAYYSHLQPVPVGYNAMQGSLVSSLTTKNGYAAMGGQNRHCGTTLGSGFPLEPGTLLNRRFHRVNLRLSAPTPGEEDLYKHWNQNRNSMPRGTKYRIQSAAVTRSLPFQMQPSIILPNTAQNERPNTAQVPIRPAICTPPTTPNEHQNPRKVNLKTGFITIPTENASNSSCDKDISPPASPQTASSLFVNKSSQKIKRHDSSSTFSKRNSSNCNKSEKSTGVDLTSRTTNIRPASAKWRSRNRSPHTQVNNRNRRWSFTESKPADGNADGDSAYSSSQDVTTDKDHVSPTATRKVNFNITPPSTPGNNQRENERTRSKTVSFKNNTYSTLKPEGQQLRRRGGTTAFYYPNEKSKPHQMHKRPCTASPAQLVSAMRHPNPPASQRPQTQPASVNQHRNTLNKINEHTTLRATPNPSKIVNKRQCADTTFFPLSLADYDTLNQHTRSLKLYDQSTNGDLSRYWNPYLNPDTGRRIISWLNYVEENPEVYYGFETDLLVH